MQWIDQTDQPLCAMPLGHTLPDLLNAVCEQRPNATALNQPTETGWQALSHQAFKTVSEAVALGLLNLGLEKGDRVALLMRSDVNFVIADMGCLMAQLVDVPIDLTQTIENIIFVLHHSEAKGLIISDLELLKQIVPYLKDVAALQHIVVATVPDDWQQMKADWLALHIPCETVRFDQLTPAESTCLDDLPILSHPVHELAEVSLSPCWQIFSLHEIQTLAPLPELQSNAALEKQEAISPGDLATIIYIPGTTGQLLGVMLTHENLAGNALAAFSSLPDLEWGAKEVILTFLPLTHVFARCLFYGHLYYGHSVYFSNPNRILKHLKEVRPTILASVPLLLEKLYSKILERGSQSKQWWERLIFAWALWLAKRYQLGRTPQGLYALLLKVADWLVLTHWRALFGGRLKYLLSGGAALKPELANVFAAAGVNILQGYGLTQTGGVACCNRMSLNRAGTVGIPIPGIEVKLAEDSEILIRGPYITSGYYKNQEATQEAINPEGWLHTGDLGTFTAEGLLQISGIKKALFKLSTGKYIAPQPIEARLKQSPFIAQAVIVGSEQKFCAALIIPDLAALHTQAQEMHLDLANESVLQHPCILGLYQAVIETANCHLPYWAIVKRFRLIHPNELAAKQLSLAQPLDRAKVMTLFASEIAALYHEGNAKKTLRRTKPITPVLSQLDTSEVACPTFPTADCPTFAQSLNPRFTT